MRFKYKVINLLYGTTMFTGTEIECKEWVEKEFGGTLALLLVDIKVII